MKIVRMLTLVSISLTVLLPKYFYSMQEAVREDQASSSTQAPKGTKNYTLADIAIAIAYTSDHHEGNVEQAAKKEGFNEMTPTLFSRWPNAIKIEIRAGDHIEGKEAQGALHAFCDSLIAHACSCFTGGSNPKDEANTAIHKIKDFENSTGIHVAAGPGNHDFYDNDYTIPNWIIERHGSLRYVITLKKQDGTELPLHIICCGVGTDQKTCEWLKEQFDTIIREKGYAAPISVFMHYDEQRGNNKNWISDAEIAKFTKTLDVYDKAQKHDATANPALPTLFKILSTYGNVQEVATGHSHRSDLIQWQPNGPTGETYFTLCAGGDKKIVSLYDAQGNRLDTLFFKAQKTAQGTYEPVEVDPVIAQPEPSFSWDDAIQCWWNHKVVNQWYTKK